MEAVKQGSAAVGLKGQSLAVIAALKRAPSELSAYQRKVFKVDDHLGVAISGLTADGRILCRYMRSECLNHKCADMGEEGGGEGSGRARAVGGEGREGRGRGACAGRDRVVGCGLRAFV